MTHPIAHTQQRGFILVLTLWVLVIVALAAGYFAERVVRATELAQQSSQNTHALLDMSSTQADILYRLSTTSITEYGLGRGNTLITLDNRPYQGIGNTIVRLQDNRGLLNLNTADDGRLQRLLGLLDIPPEQRGHLIDTLHDYTDSDTAHRLNGAEEDDYLALNLPPPSNTSLTTSWEVKHIIGWRDYPQLWQQGRLAELTTTSTAFGINPNTASAEVLTTLPGISEQLAQLVITQRKLAPIINVGQFSQLTGLPEQQFEALIGVIPSNALRITQSASGLAWALQYNITLTPNNVEAPWRTDYYSRISTATLSAEHKNILELPTRSTAPAEQAPAFIFGG